MKTENAIVEKSMAFAVRIVRLSQYLRSEKREYELASQVLRSGTSIGANVHEAIYGQSRGDFISKMSIALKEASESVYWLDLLHKTDIIDEQEYRSIGADAQELRRILASIVKTSKETDNS